MRREVAGKTAKPKRQIPNNLNQTISESCPVFLPAKALLPPAQCYFHLPNAQKKYLHLGAKRAILRVSCGSKTHHTLME